MCCTSLHVRSGFASRARAMMAAAIGAEAEVPVCFMVQPWCRSVVTICRSEDVPELTDWKSILQDVPHVICLWIRSV